MLLGRGRPRSLFLCSIIYPQWIRFKRGNRAAYIRPLLESLLPLGGTENLNWGSPTSQVSTLITELYIIRELLFP